MVDCVGKKWYDEENTKLQVEMMENQKKTIYALGFFDGVHLGHQAILTACRNLAQQYGCNAGAVTFETHPETLVKGNAPRLINTVSQRQQHLRIFGMTEILVLPFDEKLRNMPWQEFLDMLMEKGAVGFVCGDDFRFGYRGEGNVEKLTEFCRLQNLPYWVVQAQNLGGTRISSTHIRALLEQGEIGEANRFLGHPYELQGQVVSGQQLGRTIGFPTANLTLPPETVCPRYGVYACLAMVEGERYPAVVNIGTRPTVGGERVNAEAHLLDFAGDLYGKEISLLFHKFLRPEKKFNSLEELKEEIGKNTAQTRKIFEKT